ncbi:MAG: hemolysin family protein [Defluviitaleaceae bacterium]|nr:hemolysin family protein [Defluviitaleaceae bacterium]MCL2261864.1 hemolysin family protein [Defluviitaleaceae bacterium]
MEPMVLNTISVVSLVLMMFFGAYLSASEMAFSSLSRVRINNLAESGGKRGRRAQLVVDLYETRFDEVISTVLICNNFAAITAATVSASLFVRLIPDYGYVISTFVIAAVVILFTDILPKSTTKENPEKVALFVAPSLLVFMTMLMPVNKGIIKLKNRFSAKISSPDEEAEAPQTLLEQELLFMVEEAETDGIINEDDSTLITNAIEFNEVSVWDVLTPRVNIVSIPITASIEEVAESFLESGYSRMPVVENSIDEIRGIIHLRDFLKCMKTSGTATPVALADIITPAVYTVTGAPITDVLTLLKKEKSHMAIVADEYGGTEGLVTMEDILEELVGEIWDENDEVFEDFISLEENKHKILGTAAIDKMFEYFDMEAESESNTVGGWIMDMLRRVPEVGDSFTFEKLKVTVTKTDGRRAEECEISIAEPVEKDEDRERDMEKDLGVPPQAPETFEKVSSKL